MSNVDFYDALQDEPPETIVVSGLVLMNKNKGKWHLCEKGGSKPTHACGSGGPTDPHRTYYADVDENVNEKRFNKSTVVLEPIEALEQGRLCGHCKRIIKNEFDFEQVTVTVGASESDDIERFVKLRDKTLK